MELSNTDEYGMLNTKTSNSESDSRAQLLQTHRNEQKVDGKVKGSRKCLPNSTSEANEIHSSEIMRTKQILKEKNDLLEPSKDASDDVKDLEMAKILHVLKNEMTENEQLLSMINSTTDTNGFNETEKNEDMRSAEAIENDFNTYAIESLNDEPAKLKTHDEIELCDEDLEPTAVDKAKKQKIDEFFRNFEIFWKSAKSSDLRALLDNQNGNKTLTERLKEAVIAKTRSNNKLNGGNDSKIKKEKHDFREYFRDNQPNFEEDLVREMDDVIVNDISESEDNSATFMHKIDKKQSEESHEEGKTKKTKKEEKETKKDEKPEPKLDIYEQVRQKLEKRLIEHLLERPDPRNVTGKPLEASEEIISNIDEVYTQRNESSVLYYPKEEKEKLLSDLSHPKKFGEPRTLLNDTHQTSKKSSIKLENIFKNTYALPNGNNILLEKTGNESINPNILAGIGKAVSDMEAILESAGEEIKRFFSKSRRRL